MITARVSAVKERDSARWNAAPVMAPASTSMHVASVREVASWSVQPKSVSAATAPERKGNRFVADATVRVNSNPLFQNPAASAAAMVNAGRRAASAAARERSPSNAANAMVPVGINFPPNNEEFSWVEGANTKKSQRSGRGRSAKNMLKRDGFPKAAVVEQ